MNEAFQPEGGLYSTPTNRSYLASAAGLERAMLNGTVVEGLATLCDSSLRLHVDLGAAEGILEPEEAVLCRPGEARKDIAIVSRVGKPVAVKILALERKGDRLIARLSRRLAQLDCMSHYLQQLRPGDLIPAKVTHLESFGAFLDIGRGLSSLLSVDCISVSRIAHPAERLSVGGLLTVAVKSIDRESRRIYVTLRELLGTWEENAAHFSVGQTVTGMIRSVEDYGVFVELTPNLAGLAELRSGECAEPLRHRIGHPASVYIKSILPERMKIKLVLIDAESCAPLPKRLTYYIPQKQEHISHWRYSPQVCHRVIETVFDES